jgi:hypothetical protein
MQLELELSRESISAKISEKRWQLQQRIESQKSKVIENNGKKGIRLHSVLQ